MKIGIIGAGRMGGGFGAHWHRAGHDLFFGARDPAKAEAAARHQGPDVGAGQPYGRSVVHVPDGRGERNERSTSVKSPEMLRG